jgi:transketolase
MRDAFVRTLIDIARRDKSVHLVTADLGFRVLEPFWEQLPEQFTNVGIAEQNMTSFAAGMALEGKVVFTYSIANFPTLRAVEQIRNDCAYHNADVKIVCVGGGLAYGALGMSHHATEDLAVMRALPDVVVLAPCDSIEAEYATRAVYAHRGTCYLRLGRGGERRIHEKPLHSFSIGKAIRVRAGRKLAIFTTGGIADEALQARDLLATEGVEASLYTFPTVKPLDREMIAACVRDYELIVTVEEHNVIGGFGGAVSEVLAEENGSRARLLKIGLQDTYASIVGSQKYLRDVYGMSATRIRDKIKDLLE